MIISSFAAPDDEICLVDGTCDELSDREFFDRLASAQHSDLIFFALSSVCWESDYRYFLCCREYFAGKPVYVTGDIFLDGYYQALILKDCAGIVFSPYMVNLHDMRLTADEPERPLPGICRHPGENLPCGAKQAQPAPAHGIVRHEAFLKHGYRFPFAHHFRFATVTTMWGCPFSCSYCTDSQFSPVTRDAESVLKELSYLECLNVSELFFADKTFGVFRQTSIPLLESMKLRHNFSWTCYFHPQTYYPELLDLMADAGCHTIIIGIDSANLAALQTYNRKVDKERLEALLKHANRRNMNICADFIIGLAHESQNDIIQTIDYALSLPIDFVSFNIAAPLPGSDIRERALEKRLMKPEHEGFDTFSHKSIIEHDLIDSDAVRTLRKKAVWKFYLRPGTLIRRIKKTSSAEHFFLQLTEMFSMFIKMRS